MSDRRLRQNAVTEIENMRSTSKRLAHRINRTIERIATGKQRQRIEIALHGAEFLHLARKNPVDAPIEPNTVDAVSSA